jgi:hypothetical protein
VIHHVALETRPADVDAETAWWAMLGFLRVGPPEALRDRAVWLERDGAQVHLMRTEEPRAAGHVAIVGPWPPPVEHEERTAHWGSPRAYATTPGGHTVEVMAAPPGAG